MPSWYPPFAAMTVVGGTPAPFEAAMTVVSGSQAASPLRATKVVD